MDRIIISTLRYTPLYNKIPTQKSSGLYNTPYVTHNLISIKNYPTFERYIVCERSHTLLKATTIKLLLLHIEVTFVALSVTNYE